MGHSSNESSFSTINEPSKTRNIEGKPKLLINVGCKGTANLKERGNLVEFYKFRILNSYLISASVHQGNAVIPEKRWGIRISIKLLNEFDFNF